jgi:hypothetical protein
MTQLQNCGSKKKKFQRTHKESSDPFCYFTISCIQQESKIKKDMCVMSLGSNVSLRKSFQRIVWRKNSYLNRTNKNCLWNCKKCRYAFSILLKVACTKNEKVIEAGR